MSLICITSPEGNVGVTTTTLQLASQWPRSASQKLVLESDPSGGSLAQTFQLSLDPNFTSFASSVAAGLSPRRLWRYSQKLPGAVEAIVSSPQSQDVERVFSTHGAEVGEWLDQLAGIVVFADLGAMNPAGSPLIESASAVLMVARPTVEQLRLGAQQIASLAHKVPSVSWVLVGDQPYGRAEVEAVYGIPVAAVLADDPEAVAHLYRGSARSAKERSELGESVDVLVATMEHSLQKAKARKAAARVPLTSAVALRAASSFSPTNTIEKDPTTGATFKFVDGYQAVDTIEGASAPILATPPPPPPEMVSVDGNMNTETAATESSALRTVAAEPLVGGHPISSVEVESIESSLQQSSLAETSIDPMATLDVSTTELDRAVVESLASAGPVGDEVVLTGRDDVNEHCEVPPSLFRGLSGPSFSETDAGIGPDGRPPSLLDGKMSTSSGSQEEIFGFRAVGE